ncbi:hypothetical protein GGR50DRAFT_487138 [Xylaria sp. CBS 124048]|nr:hypothetical protein GGR50DRAFT_487138 [Xylaria sp. CBS 124048]
MPKFSGLAASRWANHSPLASTLPSSAASASATTPANANANANATAATAPDTASNHLTLPSSSSSHPANISPSHPANISPSHPANISPSHPANISPSPRSQPRTRQPSSPEQQIARFCRIAARLKWKLPFLEMGYAIAVERLGKPQQVVAETEIHFKIDFHEYYMLIERALVHLMGVFGIVIYAQNDYNGNGYGVGDAEQNHAAAVFRDRSQPHRYHENVLLALDDAHNPLHETLGRPDVRKQLWRAKELRNLWKDADSVASGRFMPAPLEAYNLREILQTVLQALESAYIVADRWVRYRSAEPCQDRPADTSTDLQDWEFMFDAMDWEVV